MLTADLLRARTRRNLVVPDYVEADREIESMAQQLIDTFVESVGQTRGSLKARLDEIVGIGTTFLLQRGLAKLLMDRCEFDAKTRMDPIEVRQRIFESAAKAYRDPESLVFDRSDVLRPWQDEWKMEATELDRHLYADLKDEHILLEFKNIDAQALIDRYNLALAQAVLLRATSVHVTIRNQSANRYRELFRVIKFHRLLHEIVPKKDGSFEIRLDGPLSIFRSSNNYGLQLALFLPHLVQTDSWKLSAEVLWSKAKSPKKFALTSEDGLRSKVASRGQWTPDEVTFLRQRLAEITDEWKIDDEVPVIKIQGQSLIIPDFIARHLESGFEMSVEVLGFWRRRQIEDRIQTWKQCKDQRCLLAVSRDHLADEEAIDQLSDNLYVFKSTPIAREVLKRLESFRRSS